MHTTQYDKKYIRHTLQNKRKIINGHFSIRFLQSKHFYETGFKTHAPFPPIKGERYFITQHCLSL